jgi:hypothetical protein
MGFLEGVRPGTVSRVADPGGGSDVVQSSDMMFHDGVSGSPIFDANANAIGIVTATPDSPTPDAFIGLPLLTETLSLLMNRIP